MAEESAISRTGAMLGLRLPAPFSVGKVSLLLSSGGSGFWRSMATVPKMTQLFNYVFERQRLIHRSILTVTVADCCVLV